MRELAARILSKISPKYIIYAVAFIILISAFGDRTRPPPSNLAQYGVTQRIQASGATATVYHYKLPNGTSYAVKEFRGKRQGVSEEAYIASVHNEVAIAARLHHPRLLKILDCFLENGTWYTVMPYVPTTLFDRAMGNGTALTHDEVDCIFRQIVDGVAYSHDQGVAHLDIKLNNILLENETDVRLIDFGHSQFFNNAKEARVQGWWRTSIPSPILPCRCICNPDPDPEATCDKKNNVPIGRFGTPPNAPLEAYQASAYDPFPADVWGVGIIYCQLIAPNVPWNMAGHADKFAMFSPSVPQGPSPPDMIQLQATVEMVLNHIPMRARPLIGSMLQSNASHRVSMREALSDGWIRSLRRCELDLASHH
ncbi:map/microtubule affinity-regulating kinase [Penicillium coprophilum]|uniref:map/microtubule affinity-regulating kinase n=1 Tax=Penicillium coprophilum TaxID=36646 RepID=UPI00239442CB|nr:map/microtubule affinity-regulating kinase [Penicillium coprophilum]KAJ5158342.1 map/microtubule affinity-regulating kinase [Penicillium coprophilum]